MIENLTLEGFNIKVHDTKDKLPIKFLGNKPAVIDFYADWCGPCKTMYPTLSKLSDEFSETVDFYKVNVDDVGSAELTKLFNIRGIPTVVYLSADKTIIKTGVNGEHVVRGLVEEIL